MSDASSKTQTLQDVVDPARANALLAALGKPERLSSGDPLPPFFHHIYFWDAQPPEALGRDGHPATGGFIPNVGLPRRMWASGKLTFHRPLLAGVRAEKISTIESVTHKDGRSGPLAFVRIRHDIKQRHTLALSEWQDLVYREDTPRAEVKPPQTPDGETRLRHVDFDSTLLFRYSALTFNGHRIHYDEAYARNVEGYDDLVVHGPLIAQLLMLFAVEHNGPLTKFSYRATAPLMHTERATLCLQGRNAWARGPDGRQLMLADFA